jgi:hypothetical protein
MKNKLLPLLFALGSFSVYSQIGIGKANPSPSAELEVFSTDKGILIPRINLTGSTDTATIQKGNVESLLIFNIATVADIKPGYYFWYNSKWNKILVSDEVSAAPGTVTYNSTSKIFNYIDDAGNTQVINFSEIVKANETLTSLTDIVTSETDDYGQLFDKHTLTYKDEAGIENPIDLSVLVKGTETLTALTYDGSNQSLIYKDEKGVDSEFKLIDLVGEAQTLTKLEVNSDTGTLDFIDEDKKTNQLDLTDLVKEPWYENVNNKAATKNTDNIYTQGWVGIGFTTPSAAVNEKLRVNGAVTSVNSYYADYVFEDYFKGYSDIKSDYKFKKLSEVDAYIQKNKHLPGITPISELVKTKEGYAFNMSELSIQLLEKTEELYLHVIEQDKELEAKNNEIQQLKSESQLIKAAAAVMNTRLEKLEKLVSEKQ